MCLGAAIVVGGPFLCMLMTLLPIFLWRVGAEDKLMTREFPTQYPGYMQHTPERWSHSSGSGRAACHTRSRLP